MPMRESFIRVSAKRAMMIAALAALALQTAGGQKKQRFKIKCELARSPWPPVQPAPQLDRTPPKLPSTLKTAAEAVGVARWSGVGGQHLPEVDVINTMEFWGSGN